MLTPSDTGIAKRCEPAKVSARILIAASGRRRSVSGNARMRSRSICGDDSTPVKRGEPPRLSSASPRSRIGRSSGPYWNSICSITARVLLPSILAGQAPGLEDLGLRSCRRPRQRTRERHAADETRRAVLDREKALGVDGQRPIDRIDIEPHAQALVADTARRNPIGIVLSVGIERSLPFDRAGERAQLALELELVEHHAVAARGVGQQRAAVADVEALDRDRFRIEADRRRRPFEAAVAVERDRDLGALEDHVGGLELAARERAERELDAEPARPQRTDLVAARDVDARQVQRRRRQQPGVDRARRRAPAGRSSGWPGSRTRPRYLFQSTKCGPTSAATSARISAIAMLSSVACTPSPRRFQTGIRAPSPRTIWARKAPPAQQNQHDSCHRTMTAGRQTAGGGAPPLDRERRCLIW